MTLSHIFQFSFINNKTHISVSYCISPFRPIHQKYHRLGSLNNKHLFFTILEAGKSKNKVQADLVSGASCFLVHILSSSCYTFTWWKEWGSPLRSLLIKRILIPFLEVPNSWPISQRPQLLILLQWGLVFPHMNLGGILSIHNNSFLLQFFQFVGNHTGEKRMNSYHS